jgi:hypothetical protein
MEGAVRRRSAVVLASAALIMAVASTARAEPFVIAAGTGSILAFDFEGDFFRFAGNGFEVNSGREATLGFFIPRIRPASCTICATGDLVNASWRTPGEVPLASGTARFGSTIFPDVTYRGTLAFNVRPVPFPATTEGFVAFEAPFSFTASMRGFDGDREVFTADIIGAGVVLESFDILDNGQFRLDDSRITFDFTGGQPAPIPEPASMLLLASGLAAVIARTRRHA